MTFWLLLNYSGGWLLYWWTYDRPLKTFDVCNFYPPISEDLLLKALNYASRFTTITQQDRQIITHTKKSLLYHPNSPYTTKNANEMFDVTVGSYDRAEMCELIGAYILSLIARKFKNEVGLWQGHSKRNWKNQIRSLPSVQIKWP